MGQARTFESLRGLLPFAKTDRQREIIQAVMKHGSMQKYANASGANVSQIARAIQLVESYGKRRGYAPEYQQHNPVPDGQYAKGVSTLYGASGEVRMQWVKSQAEQENQERSFREALEAFKEDVPKTRLPPKRKGIASDPNLLNLYVLTDFHLGAYAWHEESGEDWDMKIAEDLLVAWFADAIANSPHSESAVLAQLGDFTHYDGYEPLTPQNKHLLDSDSRFPKMVRTAIRVQRRVHQMMLEKYDRLHLIVADANHDPASAVWQREMFNSFYEKEDRITVDNSPDTYYCVEHGKVALFFHHGHKRGPKAVDDVFAAKFREVFGRTKFAYAHLGHMHHELMLETNLMLVEQHPTMAAKDAYASRGGYMAGRRAPTITYHKNFGEVGRRTTTPEMVQ